MRSVFNFLLTQLLRSLMFSPGSQPPPHCWFSIGSPAHILPGPMSPPPHIRMRLWLPHPTRSVQSLHSLQGIHDDGSTGTVGPGRVGTGRVGTGMVGSAVLLEIKDHFKIVKVSFSIINWRKLYIKYFFKCI